MKKYYSVDTELSGRLVGQHSMISLGACIVGDRDKQFYSEIKPISCAFEKVAMRIASMGLECLKKIRKKSDYYDPMHRFFRPECILRLLYRDGVDPAIVMRNFSDWIDQTRGDAEPVFLAKPVKVDIPFIHWYLIKFNGSLGSMKESDTIDLEETYRTLTKKPNVSIKELGLLDSRSSLHNALDDAVLQAEQYEKILELEKQINEGRVLEK